MRSSTARASTMKRSSSTRSSSVRSGWPAGAGGAAVVVVALGTSPSLSAPRGRVARRLSRPPEGPSARSSEVRESPCTAAFCGAILLGMTAHEIAVTQQLDADATAAQIWAAYTEGAALDALDPRPRTNEEGYAVQHAIERLAGEAAGYKIAATSLEGQANIGVDQPF